MRGAYTTSQSTRETRTPHRAAEGSGAACGAVQSGCPQAIRIALPAGDVRGAQAGGIPEALRAARAWSTRKMCYPGGGRATWLRGFVWSRQHLR